MALSRSKAERRKYYFLQTIQWIVFLFLILFSFVVSTAGTGLKPLLLIPLAVCISSHTGEIQSMAVGTICGLLLDISCGKLIGYNAIWLVVACVAVSLLYNYLLRQKLINILVVTGIVVLVQGYLDFLFYHAIWGHDHVILIYTEIILPGGGLTLLSTIPIYYFIKWIAKICKNRRVHVLEKTKLGSVYVD